MFAFVDRLLDGWAQRRALRRFQSAPAQTRISAPPTPEGWRIVPHASPDITAYEVVAPLNAADMQRRATGRLLGSNDFCGLNSAAFCGFPPETLQIGAVELRFDTATHRSSLVYRFDYKPSGWRQPGSLIPSCDFNLLPLGGEEAAHASA